MVGAKTGSVHPFEFNFKRNRWRFRGQLCYTGVPNLAVRTLQEVTKNQGSSHANCAFQGMTKSVCWTVSWSTTLILLLDGLPWNFVIFIIPRRWIPQIWRCLNFQSSAISGLIFVVFAWIVSASIGWIAKREFNILVSSRPMPAWNWGCTFYSPNLYYFQGYILVPEHLDPILSQGVCICSHKVQIMRALICTLVKGYNGCTLESTVPMMSCWIPKGTNSAHYFWQCMDLQHSLFRQRNILLYLMKNQFWLKNVLFPK